ncbi:hypothetical protein [Lysinibacillus capsici]|uniref:hypothetical protein n=1 Tax=Lysinibacillus capsici TaxID=2115968 RepID=UPI0024803909|nr:hypothetical protein [Lysinibacillus capsici]
MEEKFLTRYELNNSYVFFQGKIFTLKEIKTRLINDEQNKEIFEADGMLEVLPSIYMKLEITMPKLSLTDRLLKRIGFKNTIRLKHEETYKLSIDARNIRDPYQFHSYLPHHISKSTWETELIKKNVIHYLEHDKWGYPDTLGGGPRDLSYMGTF